MTRPSSLLGPLLLGVVAIAGVACSKKGAGDADQSVPVVVATARQGGFVVYRSQPGTSTLFDGRWTVCSRASPSAVARWSSRASC